MHYLLNHEKLLRFTKNAWADGRQEHGDVFLVSCLPKDKNFPLLSTSELPFGDLRCEVCTDLQGTIMLLDLSREELESLPKKELHVQRGCFDSDVKQ